MVALVLLVLLTLAAIGMSRNSFQTIVNSAYSRQGTMAQNVSDSGLEWSIYWIAISNAPSATGEALNLVNLKNSLLQNNIRSGIAYDVHTGTAYTPGGSLQTDMEVVNTASLTAGYTLGLTRMGKLPIMDMSQGSGPGAFTPAAGTQNAQAPDLWAIRSDAQVQQGSVTFISGKEAWVSTPVQ
jgi:Tfp pilus assembly protein PilX